MDAPPPGEHLPRPSTNHEPSILGTSPALLRAMAAARRVGPTSASVLIKGESGTGKELFARMVHSASGRPGAFVPLNCAALPEALLESMLFGHRRGAFTGATESAHGLVVAADGGTLFLDEVGELPAAVQAKLLRVLQERTVLPVGETRERPVDVRVVAASHRDLVELVAQGRFRQDLYFRLARFELELPPLRERAGDVILIARSFLRRGVDGLRPRGLGRSAERVLLEQSWPGNVRELENVLFRASLRCTGRRVSADDLAGSLSSTATRVVHPALSARVLAHVRREGDARSSDVADALGVPRSTVKRLLRALVDAGDLLRRGEGKATLYLPVQCALTTDPRERAALSIVEREGRVTRNGLAKAAGLPTRTAGRVLAGLVASGVLAPDGRTGKAQGYRRAVRVAA